MKLWPSDAEIKPKVYNVTDYTALHPLQTYEAANYDPARRKTLDRPSTMDDVIDFIVEFMNSDVSCLLLNSNYCLISCRMWAL